MNKNEIHRADQLLQENRGYLSKVDNKTIPRHVKEEDKYWA